MASFGDGFSRGLMGGYALGERYNNRQQEKQQGKLFEAAYAPAAEQELQQEGQMLNEQGQQRQNIMGMMANATQGDITKAIVDNYVASGGKVNEHTYKLASGVASTLFSAIKGEKEYQQNNRLFDMKMQNYDSQITDRAERRKLMAQKNENDSKLFGLTVMEKQANIADKQARIDEKNQKIEKEQGERQMTIQKAYDSAYDGIDLIDNMISHKGREKATGWQSSLPTVAGSDSADFEAMVDTLKSKNFMNQIQSMRGMGALSDAEGKKVSDAITSLNLNQSDESFKKALETIKSSYERLVKYSEQEASKGGMKLEKRKDNRTVVRTGTSNGRRVVQYSDGSVEYAD